MNEYQIKRGLIERTNEAFDIANRNLERSFDYPEILFDLRGCVAGRAYWIHNKIRYNLGLAIDNYDDFMKETCFHEAAHIITNLYFNRRVIHGKEWKWVMCEVLRVEPQRCHNYDVSKHRVKKRRRFVYDCHCSENCMCGPKHHNMIQRGFAGVRCRMCRKYLLPEYFLREIDIDNLPPDLICY